MRSLVAVGILAAVVGVWAAVVLHGDDWQSKTAAQKMNVVWPAITADSTPGTFPGALELAQIFIESLDTSFDTIADDMPYQGPFGWFQRQKLIHSVGAIAKCKWQSVGSHSYTGIFKGADQVLCRASLAKPADAQGTVPGMAFKFFRNNRKSANFVSMFDLGGQPSYNYFKNDFSNHAPWLTADAGTAQKLLAAKFEGASQWAVMVGLSDLASYDQYGNNIASPRFPYRLQFHPPKNIRSLLPETAGSQGVHDLLVSNVPANSLIYEVWAQATPGADMVKIANVQLNGGFVTSKYSDRTLFFQHQRMDDDLELRPEWVGPAYAIKEQQQASKFNWPQIPDGQ